MSRKHGGEALEERLGIWEQELATNRHGLAHVAQQIIDELKAELAPTPVPSLRDRIAFAISVLETIDGESRDDVLPEWFRREWLHDELVPLLRQALTAIPSSRTPTDHD